MATTFKVKRSTVGGVTPTTGDISIAELAINLADRKIFTSNGSNVFELGSNVVNIAITGNATINAIVANGGLGTAGQVLHSNGTSIYWAPDDNSGGTVTSVATGNGLTGGPVTTTGTVSILANSGVTANTTGLYVTQGTGLVVNATGVHVNSLYINTISANSATYLGASITLGNATGIYTTGTINAASYTVGTSTIANSTGVYTGVVNGSTLSVGTSVTANSTRIVVGTAVGLQANGSLGTAGHVLHSNGTSIYWAADDNSGGTVTSVATGNGLTGGPITATGTVSILANSGVTANATGLYVTQGTGTVVNATGVHVNSTYIGTLAANSATYLGSVNNLGNATGIYTTGTINAASHTVGTSTIANATGVFTTGTVNGATLSVGTSLTANSTRLVLGTAVGLQANGGIGTAGQVLSSNGTTVYWATTSSGGATIVANTTDTQTFFIPMANITSGSWSNAVVSNTKLYFVPSTGTLNATIFNSLSDRDQKINIVTAPVGIIDVIRGVEYDWKDTGKKSSGVIAQEIEEYLPHLVDTKDGSKSVNYAGLIAYLIEEIKQLKNRVKILENE